MDNAAGAACPFRDPNLKHETNWESEVKFQRELNVPLALRAGDLAERQAGDVDVRRVEVRRVCQVEKFGPELDPLRFDWNALLQRHIQISQAGAALDADARVAQRAGHGLLKIRRIEPRIARPNQMFISAAAHHVRTCTLGYGARYVPAGDGQWETAMQRENSAHPPS